MLEALNKGWGGAHLPVQRGHELVLPASISLMILKDFTKNIRHDDSYLWVTKGFPVQAEAGSSGETYID